MSRNGGSAIAGETCRAGSRNRNYNSVRRDLPDRVVESRIEVHEGAGGPESLVQLLARHHLARAVQQQLQDLERLLGKPDLPSALAELA